MIHNNDLNIYFIKYLFIYNLRFNEAKHMYVSIVIQIKVCKILHDDKIAIKYHNHYYK